MRVAYADACLQACGHEIPRSQSIERPCDPPPSFSPRKRLLFSCCGITCLGPVIVEFSVFTQSLIQGCQRNIELQLIHTRYPRVGTWCLIRGILQRASSFSIERALLRRKKAMLTYSLRRTIIHLVGSEQYSVE